MVDSAATDAVVSKWAKLITVPVTEGNRVLYLIDGQDTLRAMCEAIRTTHGKGDASAYYVYLLGWWLDDDLELVEGDHDSTVRALLTKAAAAGAQVRVMLWDQAFKTKNSAEIRRVNALRDRNGKVTGAGILDGNTMPVSPKYASLLAEPEVQGFVQDRRIGSHHQKLLVVKGAQGLIGLCGGVDINKDRVMHVNPTAPMHDVHCRIEGPAVNHMVDVFVQRWLAHPDHGKLDKDRGPLRGLADRVPTGRAPVRQGEQFVGIVRTFNVVDLDSSVRVCVREQSIRHTMVAAIKAAKRFIYIEDQYLVNLEAAAALKEVLPHIQHLTILIPPNRVTDLPFVREARTAFMNVLYESPAAAKKVRVFVRAVNPMFTGDWDAYVMDAPHTYIHAKTWIIDDELAVIGSANCNRRGWESDSEVGAVIFDKPPAVTSFSFAQKLRMALWAEHLGVDPLSVVNGEESGNLWLDLTLPEEQWQSEVIPVSPVPMGTNVPQKPNSTARVFVDRASVVRYDPRKSPDTVGILLAIAIALGVKRERLWPIIDPTTDGLPACTTVDPVREKGPHRGGARSVPLILRQHAPSAGAALPSGGP